MGDLCMNAVVVVPTYNERENLPKLVDKISQHAPGLHILVVDDNSPDGTGELAEQLSRTSAAAIFVLHRDRKEGLGRAYVAGFTEALRRGYEIVLQMDADLSHDPAYLPAMVEAAQTADLVVGSRYVQGISIVHWPLHRLIVSQLGTAYARLLTGLPLTDCTSGFKCWRAPALRRLDLEGLRSNGYVFQVEMVYVANRLGFCFKEVPFYFADRRFGKSKMSFRIQAEAAVRTWQLIGMYRDLQQVETRQRQ
jgi:dolichol-phosphate mannosyltransferase